MEEYTFKKYLPLNILFVVVLLLLIGVFTLMSLDGDLIRPRVSAAQAITLDQLKQKIDGQEELLLIDMRSQKEYINGRLPGAVHFPANNIDYFIKVTDAKSVAIYCGELSCSIAREKADKLAQDKQITVYYVDNTNFVNDWIDKGYQVSKGINDPQDEDSIYVIGDNVSDENLIKEIEGRSSEVNNDQNANKVND